MRTNEEKNNPNNCPECNYRPLRFGDIFKCNCGTYNEWLVIDGSLIKANQAVVE
jgi:hypothetical protein